MVKQIIFVLILASAIYFFYNNVRIIARNIRLGRDISINDNRRKRWMLMLRVAIGQSKMVVRPVSAIMHILVYTGFIIINIEMLEILIDGIFGTHRLFSFIGNSYNILITVFEFFAIGVIFGCIIFLVRRNILRLKRFWNKEMTTWPRTDANIILITEIFLMSAILLMNASDTLLQSFPGSHYADVGGFTVSSFIAPLLSGMSEGSLVFVERFCWWFHIVGVLAFLNYIPYSKHFHVFLAFPNVYYSKLKPKGELANMPSITREVMLMLNEEAGAAAEEETAEEKAEETGEEISFGAKDVKDLTWKSLMDAYTCTECGRCTSGCPASITGKRLSPRKIVMDTRDRLEIAGRNINKKGRDYDDGKSLFDFISHEELWACTTCNACTVECPVNIDHVSIIVELRRYLVMEMASAPGELNSIFTNIENNGAPWQFSPEDRLLWADKIEVPVMADMHARGVKPEYLFWVGCAGAFDDRYKKVARSFAKILNHLKINYAVLGTEESCTGDPARRAGNEMVFQMQALTNIEVLNGYEVKNIITICPHCYNVFKNEYPELGGKYNVINYTMFLKEQLESGKLKISSDIFADKLITYHDPCYLGRCNDIFDPPREVLDTISSRKVEMKRNKSFALCCGAGGGQMFKEAEKGDKEVFIERIEDALETGANIIATACPFCMTMLTDGIKYKNKEEEIKNYDIAELIALSLNL
jgi:Fe-S oxidoreductase